MVSVDEVFAAIGVLFSIPLAYRFVLFIWLYFIRPSSIQTYLHGPRPYAIVTGATDGIGKAVAQELFARGFNLILHGRNEEKMRKVVEDIRRSGKQECDIRYFIADATKAGQDFAAMAAPYKGLNITLVIHNVGGSFVTQERVDEVDELALLGIVQMNALFPFLLTRALLPTLRSSATHGPVIVQFVGSQGADACPPRIALYASSKRFLQGLARGLDIDERVWGRASGVRFEYTSVGQVRSSTNQGDVQADKPTAEAFAKTVVARIGCGWRIYAPFWVHAVQQWSAGMLGERVVERYATREMQIILEGKDKEA